MRVPLLIALGLFVGLIWFMTRSDPLPTGALTADPAGPAEVEEQPSVVLENVEGGEQRTVAAPVEPEVEEPDTALVEVSLAPFEEGGLRVLVLDAEGEPAEGVRVELRMAIAGMGEDDRGAAESRADGWARIDLEDSREILPFLEQSGMKAAYSVHAEASSPEPVFVALDTFPVDGQEVTLELAATGSIDLTITLPDGSPIENEASYAWWWKPAGSGDDASWERPHSGFGKAPRGRARVDGVGLGLVLQISASMPGRASMWHDGFTGPTRAGEVIAVTVPVGDERGAYTYRVLDPDGRPVPEESLLSALRVIRKPEDEARPPRSSWGSARTDADGIVRREFGPSEYEHRRQLVVDRGDNGHAQQKDPNWARGVVEFPRVFAAGETVNLGDVQLVSAETIVAGSVVGPDGAPVPKADVWLRERWGETYRDSWTNLARVRTDAFGEFRVRGVHTPRFIEVSAYADGFESSRRTDVEVGDTDVRIELEAAKPDPDGAIAVKVLLDEGVPFMRCLLKFRNEKGQGRSPDWMAGFDMEVDHLPPGTYDVWVETRDGDFELGRVSGIVVETGETTRDAQLLPFDLRGTARVATLEVVRSDGSPWRKTELTIQAIGEGRSFWIDTDERGLASFILPLGVNELEMRAGREGPTARVTVGPGDDPTRVELAP